MRARICVLSSLCLALFLLGHASAQDLCMSDTALFRISFDGFLFSLGGPDAFTSAGAITPVSFDSTVTGEVFMGMTPCPDILTAVAALIPGLTTCDTRQGITEDDNYFSNHGDIVVMKYALLVDADPADLNDPSLYHFINQWYGVRYKWGGNSNEGIDCSGLSQKTYGSVYNVAIRRTSKQQYRHSQHFKRYTDAEEGDLVFFRINRIRISHVGIYLTNGYFVHSTRSKGVIISNLSEKYWKRRYAGCGRIIHEVRGDMESALAD